MRYFVIALCCLMLVGCCCNCQEEEIKEGYYVPQVIETDYTPRQGRIFHVAGFDIKEGQQMRDFFDDFEEPMHTYYNGNIVEWTYYVDYNAQNDEGRIVRYCEFKNYRKKLCKLKVTFDHTYVSNATSNCK